MAENDPTPDPDPNPPAPDDTDEAVELASLAVDDGKGGKVVPLSALIGSKKELKALRGRVKELEPVAARVSELDGKLSQAQPIINAVLANPKLMAEALRIAGGGAPSRETTVQPTDDVDARDHAEDMGWYLGDGHTPDIARGRRVLDRQAKAVRQVAEEVVRPLGAVTLHDRAERNIQNAIRQTDDNGVPYATEQSIREVAARLPQNLLASPEVVELMLDNAAGVDRRNKRTPKAQEEPLFLESAGGRGRPRDAALDSDTRRMLERVGLTEAEYRAGGAKAETAASTRRGIVLGK